MNARRFHLWLAFATFAAQLGTAWAFDVSTSELPCRRDFQLKIGGIPDSWFAGIEYYLNHQFSIEGNVGVDHMVQIHNGTIRKYLQATAYFAALRWHPDATRWVSHSGMNEFSISPGIQGGIDLTRTGGAAHDVSYLGLKANFEYVFRPHGTAGVPMGVSLGVAQEFNGVGKKMVDNLMPLMSIYTGIIF